MPPCTLHPAPALLQLCPAAAQVSHVPRQHLTFPLPACDMHVPVLRLGFYLCHYKCIPNGKCCTDPENCPGDHNTCTMDGGDCPGCDPGKRVCGWQQPSGGFLPIRKRVAAAVVPLKVPILVFHIKASMVARRQHACCAAPCP